MTNETKKYEISLVFSREEAYASAVSLIREKAERVLYESQVQRIRLAYPIKKEEAGFFAWIIIAAAPGVMPTLQKDIEMNPSILRVLIITPPLPAKIEGRAPSFKDKATKDKPRREPARPLLAEEPREIRSSETLTNELLEKKLEEILK